MFKKSSIFYIHAITPLHAGSGDSLGIVDMPIQRERHSSFPKIEGSSLKGSIREVFDEDNKFNKEEIKIVFGPEDNGDEHAGALGFTDARILLFPVKSVKGVFAYVTCPSVIKRFKKELELSDEKTNISDNYEIKNTDEESKCITTNETALEINSKVILEEYTFTNTKSTECDKLAEYLKDKIKIDDIKAKLAIISDDDFKDFVSMSTEVITRTKINNETGTVERGGLFTEEYLPAESVMYSMALSCPPFLNDEKNKTKIKNEEDVLNFFLQGIPEVIQIGGNATLGKGIVRIVKGGAK